MSTKLSTGMVADRLGIPTKEVLRHIRDGDIEAIKFGWVWAVDERELPKIMKQDWYKRIVARQRRVA